MSTQRTLLLSYIVLGGLLALVLAHFFGGPVAGLPRMGFLSANVFDQSMFWAYIAGAVTAAAVGVFCWFDLRVRGPATEVIEELQRVTWPTFHETRVSAVAVLVASAICAVLLGVFDQGWHVVTQAIYSDTAVATETSDSQNQ
jgi:preprotein translocase subunit SecE